MSSPSENLYPEADPEPVFAQLGPVSSTEPLPVSACDILPLEQFEEGEVSDPEDQPDPDTRDTDRILSEDQNYRETVRGVCAFMGWTHIPDLKYSPATSR